MERKTEKVEGGIRKYITPEQLATVKIGETYSLDRFNDPHTHIVVYDGVDSNGYHRWVREAKTWGGKTDHVPGRTFVYTTEQCCRLIYTFVPDKADPCASVADSIADDFFEPTSGAHSRLRDAILKLLHSRSH